MITEEIIYAHRFLKNPSRKYLPTKKPANLDEILADNSLIENLEVSQLSKLRELKTDFRDLAIIDYIANFSDIKKYLSPKSDLIEIISEDYFDLRKKILKENKQTTRGLGFSNPIKQMALLSIISNIKNSNSMTLLEGSRSSNDIKKVLFFDRVYGELSQSRKSRVDSRISDLTSISEILDESVMEYIFQTKTKYLNQESGKIETLLEKINEKDLTISSFQEYQSLKKSKVPSFSCNGDKDLNDARESLDSLQKRLNETINSKISEKKTLIRTKEQELVGEYVDISNLTFPIPEEINSLEESVSSLEREIDFFTKTKNELRDNFGDTIQRTRNLITDYREINLLSISPKNLSNIADSLISNSIRHIEERDYKNFIKEIQEKRPSLSKLNIRPENQYFLKLSRVADRENGRVNLSLSNYLSNKNSILSDEEQEIDKEITSTKSKPLKIFKRQILKIKRHYIRKELQKINELSRELNLAHY